MNKPGISAIEGERVEAREPAPPRFRLIRFDDIPLARTRPYVIRDLIPREALTVGTLLHGSWGYDQTQCELWEVVGRPTKHFAEVRRVKAERSPERAIPGPMVEYLRPIQGAVYGDTERKKIGPYGLSFGLFTLSPTTAERAHYSSWYA